MAIPRLRMDFNGYSLTNRWTLEDTERQGIKIQEGSRYIFYDFDAVDGESGILHTVGVVWWDAKSNRFMLDMRTVDFQFTPGSDVTVLDTLYPD